jgi:hypothetical protein
MRRSRRGIGSLVLLLSIPLLAGSCSIDALLASIGSLGGSTAGQRGNTQVVFINNTPFRAIFSFGGFDDLDTESEPTLLQFGSSDTTGDLEGNTQSDVLTIPCARLYSIGSTRLIAQVRSTIDEANIEEAALVYGVNFSSAAVDDDDADAATEGKAAPLESRIAADFECGALLIYRFEINDAGPDEFVVELTIIPAKSNRGVDNGT